jgi:rhamnogalacturonan acetylesterase
VNSFKAKGASVIVSSQTPDDPFIVGTGTSRFVGYAASAASDTGVSYVDHFSFVLREFEALGNATVSTYYPIDHLHTNAAGADIVAQTFVRGVLCAGSTNPLFKYVNNTKVVPGKHSLCSGRQSRRTLIRALLATCS